MNRLRIALLLVVALAGIYVAAPAVRRLAERWNMPDESRQWAVVVILETVVAVGTLTWLHRGLPASQRVTGAAFVIGALAVTLTAGVQSYGPMGLVAPLAYVAAAHLTALALGDRSSTDSGSDQRFRWQRLSWERRTDAAPEARPARHEAPASPAAPVVIDSATGDDLADRIRALRDENGQLPSKRKTRDELRVSWQSMAPVYDQVAQEARR